MSYTEPEKPHDFERLNPRRVELEPLRKGDYKTTRYSRDIGTIIDSSPCIAAKGKTETTVNALQTHQMGKGAYQQLTEPVTINGQRYGFLNWKGLNKNPVADELLQEGRNQKRLTGMLQTLPSDKDFQLFIAEDINTSQGPMVRFNGSAFHADLLYEFDMWQEVTADCPRLRTPYIIAVHQYSTQFARDQNIPEPGESFNEYMARAFPQLQSNTLHSQEVNALEDASLGQMVRLMRNPYRVSDLEEIITANKTELLRSRLQESQSILSTEFPDVISIDTLIRKQTELFGIQVAELWQKQRLHQGMKDHRQNCSLAAEIADWDSAETFEQRAAYRWGGNMSKVRTEAFFEGILIGAHMLPQVMAAELVGEKSPSKKEVAELFARTIISDLVQFRADAPQKLLQLLQMRIPEVDSPDAFHEYCEKYIYNGFESRRRYHAASEADYQMFAQVFIEELKKYRETTTDTPTNRGAARIYAALNNKV